MIVQRFIEKEAQGKLQGLVLLWQCAHHPCETNNTTWLIRNEAKSGEKHTFCTCCKGKNFVKFTPSNLISEREKFVNQALQSIPATQHKEILEDLAWTEALFVAEGDENIAQDNWEKLKFRLNLGVQKNQNRPKN